MPRVARRTTIRMNGWPGGLAKDSSEALYENEELAEALNVVLGLRGEIQKRNGYLPWGGSASPAQKIERLQSWRLEDAHDYLMGFDPDGDIFIWEDLATSPVTGPNIGNSSTRSRYPIGMATANGELYITAKRSVTPRKFDGTTFTSLPDFPQAQFLSWRYDQMFAANVASGQASTIWISYPLDPEDFTTEPVRIQFDPEDGEQITGIHASGEQLLVFKEHSIHLLTGKTRLDFAKYQLDELRGTFSPDTIKQVRGLVIFFDRDTGIWAWDGSTFSLISQKINDYMLNNVTYAHAWRATAYVDRDKYIISLPWDSEWPDHSFVYSTLTNTWTEWSMGFQTAEFQDTELFYGAPDQLNGLQHVEGYTDNGAPITITVETPWMFPGSTGAISRMRRVEINVKATGEEIGLTLYQDYVQHPITGRTFIAENSAIAIGGCS